MRLASLCIQFISTTERNISRLVERAVSEERSKLYINVLSDVKSFLKNFKELTSALRGIEELLPELKCGRVCFRWFYAEDKETVALTRLEPRLSLLYTGDRIRITYDDRAITLYPIPKIEFTVNQYHDVIDLSNEDDVLLKRSLLLDAISRINQQIERAVENLNLCIKQLKRRVS